ncbi:endo-1,4-beta-mannosidase [Neptunitalea chrysea]|uniref:mannan endo-1,4-beta-mannosidase n=1 Tax=Neptunitalea chrysea TaxID=1647581 RepID=A0A9W6EU60_9FLAO|nr:beta-mannanase [Neptunitalea chrysea]GLB51291.1 endo-1,4-beta-mannosidase [Neptunitalea chrysea]
MHYFKNIILALLSFYLVSCGSTKSISKTSENNSFVTVKDGIFYKNGSPYHYIGTNYWYGAILASEKYGNRERLSKELDELKENGMVNLRILFGAEGGDQDYTVRPALQYEQGKYDDALFEGLDYLLAELAKRDMTAVLYLTNNWEWSGGIAKYLQWNGYGDVPNPNIPPHDWPEFMEFTPQFYTCKPCQEAFRNHIKYSLKRTNRYTHTKYIEDPAIMAWQVANEPRIFTVENEANFTKWINETVDLIDSLDANHLISTGSEGKASSNDDILAYKRSHSNPNIDYLTMHTWPKNWGWYQLDNEENATFYAIDQAIKYIDEHTQIARELHKPIVLEEFGFPREQESLDKNACLEYRNVFYTAIFNKLEKSIKNNEPFVALNFWGYGGIGENNPENGKWNPGDDFTTDPPMEPQGLNSIFSTDKSTLYLIKMFNGNIE